MNPETIIPVIFRGLPVSGLFTTKAFQVEAGKLKAQIHAEAVYLPVQKHTGKVLVVEYDLEPKIADAVVTRRKNLAVGVQVADCVPVLLYDSRRHVAGAVHAGWRGTAEAILKKTITVFRDCFNSSPADIRVAIGPSIKGNCYVVGYEVVAAVTRATGKGDYVTARGEMHYVDLPAANRVQAVSEGILPENIWVSPDCTHCRPDMYYSYRYAKGTAGRQFGLIMMRRENSQHE